jgi:hypothetical protein
LDGIAILNLRGPEAKMLILMVAQEKEWQLYAPEGRPPEVPELPFKIPGIWAEDNSPYLAWNVPPSSGGIKARNHSHQSKTVLHSPQGSGQNSKTP